MASAYEADSQDLRIVLLGVCGAGKSSTGNAILGREAFKESRTRESEIQRGRVKDQYISIIDTPGFFNTQLTDEEMKKQMMKSLFLSDPGPHVFLLVINLENFREEKRNVVEKIQENFGAQAFKFTIVLFIGREKVSKREFNQITESEETKKILNNFERRFHVINSKGECDPYQITMLLKIIDEMVKNNGGQSYSNEIYLKNQIKLREQQERMKHEENMKQQEEKEQKGGKHSDEKTKTKNERMKETKKKNEEDVSKEKGDIRIVILGKTGAGRSATGNTILGRNAFRESLLSSTQTCEKEEALVFGRSISIIDTPGLLDSRWYRHFQDELKRDIEKCLEMSAPGPHVFLLAVRLNGRYTEREKNTVKWIQENFGEEAVRHTIVLFTHVDLLKDESLDQYIRKTPDLQSLIDSCGGRSHSFNNEDRSNQNQVTELLEKIEQLIKDNKGQHYANETCLEAQNNLRQQREKQEDMRIFFPFSSPQEKREQETAVNQEDINTQSQEESNKGDNENNQEGTERESDMHELRRETGHLLGLMMGLELSEMALRLSLASAMAQSNLSRQGLRIVLLGLLGEGKSSAGNTILGRNTFGVSALMTTRSCEKQAAVVFGKPISIIDTPAILIDPMWLPQFYEIEKSLAMSAPGPHAFLLVIKVGRFTEERTNTIRWIQNNIENDAFNHTIVLFTHTDLLNVLIKEPLKVYIKLHNDLQSLIESCGGRYHSINNKELRNRIQVIELLMKIDEMVQRNGGRHYTKHTIFKRAQKQNTKQDVCEIQ